MLERKTRKFTCIMCPKGCEICAVYEIGEAADEGGGAVAEAAGESTGTAAEAAGEGVGAKVGAAEALKTCVNLISLEGNGCKKGKEYVMQELTNPMRNIASSILVIGGEIPLASCRLTKPIPKARIFDVMAQIRQVTMKAPVEEGDVAIADVLGLGADVIITKAVGCCRDIT